MTPELATVSKYRKVLLLLVIYLSLSDRAHAQQVNVARAQRSVSAKSALSRLRLSVQTLQNVWLVSSPSGGLTWAGINAWQRFVLVDSLAQYTELSGDRSYLPQIERIVSNHEGLDGNDDDLWAVIASLHVYRLNRSPDLLTFSQAKFTELTDNYWDETCGGGIWWDHSRTYKNAITNELFLYAATALYTVTKDPVYRAWARKEWVWFRSSGMINPDNLVNDGLTPGCKNNKSPTYTYNQGVILGALVNLYRMEGDGSYIDAATFIAQAAVSNLTGAGILQEPTTALNQDGQTFKGIFVYYLGDLIPFVRENRVRGNFSNFISGNADTLWRHRRKGLHELNAYWGGTPILYGAAAQSAGINLFGTAFRAASTLPQSSSLQVTR